MSARVADLPRAAREIILEGAVEREHPPALTAPVIYRDAQDVRLLLRLSTACMVLILMLIASGALNVAMYYRRPDRIVVERTPEGDNVIIAGNTAVKTGVSVEKYTPGDREKLALAGKFSSGLFTIDPKTRSEELERTLLMMEGGAMKALVEYWKQNQTLEREREENWYASWKPQKISVDERDPNRVNVVGVQEITKIASGQKQEQTRQLMFGLRMLIDKKGPDERNLFTGYQIGNILDFSELQAAPPATSSTQLPH